MILALFAVLVQAVPPASPDRPIRVWLGTPQPVAPGAEVQVFVRAATDGYLTVLRRTTDGRIEILFPAAPTDEAFISPGTYEVRGTGPGGAFAALEPPGTGLVLAALSVTPFRSREFARQAAWNPEAIVPSWGGMDAEGALTDIVQRMLGDGYFAYDVVAYTVAPAAAVAPEVQTAGVSGYDTCMGCVFPSVTLIVASPFTLVCDPFFLVCEGLSFFPQPGAFDPGPAEPVAPQRRVLGVPSASRTLPAAVTRGMRRSRFVIPERPAAPQAVTPRPRPPAPGDVRRRGAVVAGRAPVLRGRRPPQTSAATVAVAGPRRRAIAPARPATRALERQGPGSGAPPRSRATPAVSATPLPVAPATRATGDGAVTPSRSPIVRPTLVALPRSVAPAAAAGARTAAGGGQVNTRGQGTTRAAAGPAFVNARGSVRAGVAVRQRQ
jgi:hypothetical protein